jgi:hypothetical protein
MAETRWHLDNCIGTKFVEMPNTSLGRSFLIGLRKGRPDLFKNQRIKSVLQMEPSLIPIGTVVNMSRYTWSKIKTVTCNQRLLDSMMREMAFSMHAVSDAVWADAVTAMFMMYLGIDK